MKQNKFYYYYDEENDLAEYLESGKGTFAVWVNPYLTLMFPHGCEELTPKNAVGFQLNGMKHLLKKAKKQAEEPLSEEAEAMLKELFKDSDWEKNGCIEEGSASTKQVMDCDKDSSSD